MKSDMPQIGVRLTLDQLEKLDRMAEGSKGRVNRSDLIRRAVDILIDNERRPRRLAQSRDEGGNA